MGAISICRLESKIVIALGSEDIDVEVVEEDNAGLSELQRTGRCSGVPRECEMPQKRGSTRKLVAAAAKRNYASGRGRLLQNQWEQTQLISADQLHTDRKGLRSASNQKTRHEDASTSLQWTVPEPTSEDDVKEDDQRIVDIEDANGDAVVKDIDTGSGVKPSIS